MRHKSYHRQDIESVETEFLKGFASHYQVVYGKISFHDIEAQRRIEAITADVEIGTVYEGKIVKVLDFGAIVEFLVGRSGLVHISQICHERVENIYDTLQEGEGQDVRVKVLEIDRQGRIRLSMKEAEHVA